MQSGAFRPSDWRCHELPLPPGAKRRAPLASFPNRPKWRGPIIAGISVVLRQGEGQKTRGVGSKGSKQRGVGR
eukprot:8468180-Alexandrium_andersonii.AAC.1